jgi:hypothetical protein
MTFALLAPEDYGKYNILVIHGLGYGICIIHGNNRTKIVSHPFFNSNILLNKVHKFNYAIFNMIAHQA